MAFRLCLAIGFPQVLGQGVPRPQYRRCLYIQTCRNTGSRHSVSHGDGSAIWDHAEWRLAETSNQHVCFPLQRSQLEVVPDCLSAVSGSGRAWLSGCVQARSLNNT